MKIREENMINVDFPFEFKKFLKRNGCYKAWVDGIWRTKGMTEEQFFERYNDIRYWVDNSFAWSRTPSGDYTWPTIDRRWVRLYRTLK